MMKKLLIGLLILAAAFTLFAKAGAEADAQVAAEETETLLWLHPTAFAQQAQLDAVVAAFEAKTGIKIEIELRPGSAEGENVVKTRIAAGDMPDIMTYNSGALFQSINPDKNLLDLSGEPFADKILDSFKATVTTGGDAFYAIPIEPMNSGGVIYNKAVYDELGLEIPRTWDDFIANCQAVKAAGVVPVLSSFKETWTSQLVLLADYYNVQAVDPDFAGQYTANKAKFATNAAARRGFEKLAELNEKGLINENPASLTYEAAQEMLAKGEGAHYFMATWVIPDIAAKFPENIDDMRFFPVPGDSADSNGSTVWMPNNIAIPVLSKHQEAARQFLDFFVSDAGFEAFMSAGLPAGAFAVKGVSLPDNVLPSVKDAQSYIDAGNAVAALEFLSPVKGPNLPQLCVSAGMGLKSAQECAEEYDRDVEKAAKQLMLPGW